MAAQPVIPALREAEAGGSLEPRGSRLQLTVITPLHSSLGDRARLCVKITTTAKVIHEFLTARGSVLHVVQGSVVLGPKVSPDGFEAGEKQIRRKSWS